MRTFDRVPSFDPRSRSYPIRTLITQTPRSYTWSVPVTLDQGAEGACVGFGWAHELAARPVKVAGVTNDFARSIYYEARKVDEWDGEDYSGTSVLAGAKVVQTGGYIGEYRWAFGLQDLILALGYKGPVVLGVNWHAGMYEPDANGQIHVTGSLLGGHCILAYGVSVWKQRVKLHNSWGPDWGINGACTISFDDLGLLLAAAGEACVPLRRTL